MEIIDKELSKKVIRELKNKYGSYLKLTVDVEKGLVVAGGELHADAETLLLEKGSKQDDIWGGGISIPDKLIDTTAVLNIRPKLGNDNLEILDLRIRKKFNDIVKKYFNKLWH